MINPADWSTTKPIAAFSCTPRVQEVHTKAEILNLIPCLVGFLGIIQLSRVECHCMFSLFH